MKRLWNSFKIAFAMYSRIPMLRAEWTRENMRYVMCFFPLIGVVIGVLQYGWSFLGPLLCQGTLLISAGYVLIPVAVTGGIHLDGFLDTADALSSYQPMERRLEILKDSHAGAFAIIVGISYFLLSLGVFSELGREELGVLAGGYVLSRALSGLAVVSFPCAKNTGLVAMFSDAAQKARVRAVMVLFILAGSIWVCAVQPRYGVAVLLGAAGTFGHYYHMSKKNFGGITGDLAGYFVQVCELVMAAFVLIAARLPL
ncbi:MAG: adenosylcobinamide-GDP ribazoletransferase [Lachnospiraceae bacterium]|jgi:adenosylcobinamide-GDP ribazoletransferase|nr:adenosylcobinamide-GDP ribazoletransferase [Lachnospiraceae bacterium]MCI8994678.1 adenosylcobinamide-GDP ribazoletransferase [Lachnospiraceae bacterium]MCI9134169.1 adenosylcobinamide-GDP ribazoletransferase [Lachnospiraceae bacterium]